MEQNYRDRMYKTSVYIEKVFNKKQLLLLI